MKTIEKAISLPKFVKGQDGKWHYVTSEDRDYETAKPFWIMYEERCTELEEKEEMTRSDAQGVLDVQIWNEGWKSFMVPDFQ